MPADPEKPTSPFRAEYARSGRSSCKNCNKTIPNKELRIAALAESKRFGGIQANWHHFDCFFERNRPKSTEEIENFETLNAEDQTKIEKKIDELFSRGMSPGKMNVVSDFKVEYPRSSKSHCLICTKQIEDSEPRIGKTDYESEEARRFGPIPRWHHVNCFAQARQDIGFTASGEELEGFNQLERADQEEIREKLPKETSTMKKKTGRKPSAHKNITQKAKKPKTGAQASEEEEQETLELETDVKHKVGEKKSDRSSKPRRGGKAAAVGRGRGGGEEVRAQP